MFAALINITAIICFTILAYVFKKWWIVLFALLFMFNSSKKE